MVFAVSGTGQQVTAGNGTDGERLIRQTHKRDYTLDVVFLSPLSTDGIPARPQGDGVLIGVFARYFLGLSRQPVLSGSLCFGQFAGGFGAGDYGDTFHLLLLVAVLITLE